MIQSTIYSNVIDSLGLWEVANDASLVSLEDVDEYPIMETANNIIQDVAGMVLPEAGPFDQQFTVQETGIVDTIGPTPIGPAHAVRVVGEMSLMQFASSGESAPAALLDCLRPLLRGQRASYIDEKTMVSFRRTPEPLSMKRSIFQLDGDHIEQLNNVKRRKLSADADHDDCPGADQSSTSSVSSTEKSGPVKIRAHQSTQWNERYQELVEYQNHFGHCVVPYHYKQNAKLALWVKRQRHQYKLKHEGQHSTMSDDREAALERLGFVWDSHKAVWEERINELIAYREKHGHCNVPAKFAENSQLAIWVKCQRRQYKLFCAGERSNMTEARIQKLSEVGFVWDPRSQF